MPQQTFDSPLRIRGRTEFTAIGFGPVEAGPEVVQLRRELNSHLFRLTVGLPEPLAREARTILSGYSGGDGDFFRLFYVPIWSFLHWVPGEEADPSLRRDAREAHALGLFLHLWDDHLCDGQLPLDMLRLHVRSTAWQRYAELGRSLCLRTGADPALVEQHGGAYLDSLHRPGRVKRTTTYEERFRRQVAIWTLAPRLLGLAAGGSTRSTALCRLIEEFAIAWRWLDDIQDIHADVREEKETGVWLELDRAGRQRWADCHAESARMGRLDPRTWAELAVSIRESGCLARCLRHVEERLLRAGEIADTQGWVGMAGELEQCRQGLPR